MNFKKRNTGIKNVDCLEKIKNFKIKELKINFKSSRMKACAILVCLSIVVLGLSSSMDSVDGNGINFTSGNFYKLPSYDVYINNEKVGTVREKTEVKEACDKLKEDLNDKYSAEVSLIGDITYKYNNSHDRDLTDSNKLYEKIKENLTSKIRAYSIYSGEKKIGSLLTEEDALKLEENVKNYFLEGYDPDEIISAEIAGDVNIVREDVDFEEIDNIGDLTDFAIIGTDEKLKYTVVDGDNYWSIAYNHDMTLDELFDANPDVDENVLLPGDELSLIVPVPLINVDITRKTTEEEVIPYDVEETKVSYLYTDQSEVQTAGKNGTAEVNYTVVERNGVLISKVEDGRTILTEPSTQYELVGTQEPPLRIGTGTFINPLSGSYISSRFGNRYIFGSYSYHTGLDLAKAYGSSISAADGGTVTFAGYKGSYGNMVEIDHGDGYTTRYAHCSEFYVSVGDKVYQGQSIAAVGLTGVTTGPHCHFEIRKYGVPVDPSSYIFN